MKDHEIVSLYFARDERAVSATAEKYEHYCFTVAHNILGSREDAEECVNDTWMQAWESIPPHRPERLSTYLGKITRNLSLNRFKARQADKRGQGQTVLALSELAECVPSGESVEQVVDEMALTAAMEAFLTAQPKQRRQLFIRRYFAMTPIGELARHYGMSESRVTSLLFRMRKELKAYLEKEGITL